MIIRKLEELDRPLNAEELVDTVLDLVGPLEVQPETRAALVDMAAQDGDLFLGSEDRARSEERVGRLLRLTVASREYQFA
jgi:hypothetical protein